MTDCFICHQSVGSLSSRFDVEQINYSNCDTPLGFTDSDRICEACAKNLKNERNRLRTQGNCFFCKKTLGVDDKKYFKEDTMDLPENFTFCDMACSDCDIERTLSHQRKKDGPACSSCGEHVEGYGHTCPKCKIKVTYENQKRNKSTTSWYALSILLGILGGLIAYASIKNENPTAARDCLLTGIVVSVITIIIGMYYFGV
jgi:predicted nucleic acid-binding Zn ribbon protein